MCLQAIKVPNEEMYTIDIGTYSMSRYQTQTENNAYFYFIFKKIELFYKVLNPIGWRGVAVTGGRPTGWLQVLIIIIIHLMIQRE